MESFMEKLAEGSLEGYEAAEAGELSGNNEYKEKMKQADGFFEDLFAKEFGEETENEYTSLKERLENRKDELYETAEKIFDALFKDEFEDDREGLTPEEKAIIKEETGWSDEIIDAINSMEEYEIYKQAGLVEAEIDGKKCLIRSDIDWEQKDAMGRTNRERVRQGLSPINKDGKVIELHHIGQRADSPLAELTPEEHRGKNNDVILHDKAKESEIDRNLFLTERNRHWKARASEGDDT